MDLALSLTRAEAQHDSSCPDIGPICQLRNEPPQQHHTTLWITELRLLAEYGLTSNLAIQGALPVRLVDSRTRYTDLAGNPLQLDYENIHHRNETLTGLGDAQLFLHHGVQLGSVRFGTRIGLNIPTGKVHENPYVLGDLGLPHEHIQFGTGTFDPILAVDASKDFGTWTLASFALAHAPLYQGPQGYRAGARLFGGVTAISSFGLSGPSFRLGASALHELPERWNGVVPTDDGNQGRTDLYLGPGVTIPFGEDWSVSIDLRGRLYGHAVNAQLNLPAVLEISIGRLFHLESGAHEDADTGSPSGDVLDVVRQGEAASLHPEPGKWTVFDFWASWCEPCKKLDAELRKLAATNPTIAVRRVNIVDFDSPIATQELRGVSALPHVRIVGPDQVVRWEGTASPDEVMQRLRQRR